MMSSVNQTELDREVADIKNRYGLTATAEVDYTTTQADIAFLIDQLKFFVGHSDRLTAYLNRRERRVSSPLFLSRPSPSQGVLQEGTSARSCCERGRLPSAPSREDQPF